MDNNESSDRGLLEGIDFWNFQANFCSVDKALEGFHAQNVQN